MSPTLLIFLEPNSVTLIPAAPSEPPLSRSPWPSRCQIQWSAPGPHVIWLARTSNPFDLSFLLETLFVLGYQEATLLIFLLLPDHRSVYFSWFVSHPKWYLVPPHIQYSLLYLFASHLSPQLDYNLCEGRNLRLVQVLIHGRHLLNIDVMLKE